MKIASVVGARPQFIKSAPIVRAALKAHVDHLLIHTGQHYDYQMSEVFFKELHLPAPVYHLEVGSGSHARQTGTAMERLEPVLLKESPDWVLVYGDTNSTLAAALTSIKLGFRVAHVEAGLRSFNKAMPEEINRIVSDHVSTVLFCPTSRAVMNAGREGFINALSGGAFVEPDDVEVHEQPTADAPLVVNCGDVMYDAILIGSDVARQQSVILDSLGVEPKQYYLATIHRAANADDIALLTSLLEKLSRLDKPVVFPVHPRTADRIRQGGIPTHGLRMTEPVGYFDMLALEESATAILTDSGGVQKEAFFFKTPCVTLRDETEWIETVTSGWNTLAGTNVERLYEVIGSVRTGAQEPSPYGTGRAAETIIRCLERCCQARR